MKVNAKNFVEFRQKRYSQVARKNRSRRRQSSVTSLFVRALARREGVMFETTFADRWAGAVTRLAGDSIASDATDNLLVALARAGKISIADQLGMLAAHHRRVRAV